MRSDSTVLATQSVDITKITAARQQHSLHNPVLRIKPCGSTCSRKRRMNSSTESVIGL